MASYLHRDHVESPMGRTEAVQSEHRFSPGQVLGGIAGAVFALVGIVVIIRTGIDTTLNQPATDIFGTTQSAYVGLFELVFGLMMIAAAASAAYRGVLGFLGAIVLVAGVVVVAASDKMALEIGTSHSTGWFAIIIGAIALLGSLMPSFVRSERRVDTY